MTADQPSPARVSRVYFVYRPTPTGKYRLGRTRGGRRPREMPSSGVSFVGNRWECVEHLKRKNARIDFERIKINRYVYARDWDEVTRRIKNVIHENVPPGGISLSDLYRTIRKNDPRGTMWVTLNDVFEVCFHLRFKIERTPGPHSTYIPKENEVIVSP